MKSNMSLVRPFIVYGQIFLWFGLCLSVPTSAQSLPQRTAIDDYVQRADDSYHWKIIRDETKDGLRQVIIDMTSQTWLTKADVDRPQWQHWLSLAIPSVQQHNTGLLWIGGGANGREAPQTVSERIQLIARATDSVVAELGMVPNQPLEFHGDGQMRTEDDLIGYTWDQFLKTGDPKWPARNAMIKSAVRAMDTITEITSDGSKGSREIDQFVVAGGSKRGWTTWMTGAMDDRVVGIIPIVIDVLNVRATSKHHFAAYGFWAPAFGNYVEHRITERMDSPQMVKLMELVDPFYYRHRLKMPKFIVNGAGDQFFPPDSAQYYFHELEGVKHLRYVPNTDHSLGNSDSVESIIAYYSLILAGRPAPELNWTLDKDNLLKVTTVVKPKEVRLWQATNPIARDFRLESLGPRYTSVVLKVQEDGSYQTPLSAPTKGWTAHFIELTYDIGLPVSLKVTTQVYVLPDILPFAEKDSSRPATITVDLVAPNAQVVEQISAALQTNEHQLAVSKMKLSSRSRGASGEVDVRLNWKPKGRFWTAASQIRSWLSDLGCSEFAVRLESGKGAPLDP